ncbi:MAG: SDR family oxidoreductase, partial [Acidobacteria bacterium]|nr:SDR family oxidoreductase [Acidobacteriota bacterium]
LGKAVAMGLGKEGARVAICARTEEKLNRAAEEIRQRTGTEVLALRADVSIPSDVKDLVQKTVEHFGKLEILVANAGGPPFGHFLDLPEDAWQKALNLNLLSTLHLCRESVPHMRAAGWGRIINLTSFAAKQPQDTLILSNTARAGVLGLSKSLANELAPYNILVNTVCPGAFETERHLALSQRRAAQEGISLEEYLKIRVKDIPLQRNGKPEELADLVVFLASERASYITGTAIQIDGGLVRSLL